MNDYEITGGCLLKYAGASPVAIIPSSVTVIARCAFNHSTVQTIYLPTTLKQIESDAFSECGSVNVVVKYNTDSDIESDINSSCRALLEYLEDNSGAETVTLVLNGEKAFDGCEFEEYHEAMLRVVELDISCAVSNRVFFAINRIYQPSRLALIQKSLPIFSEKQPGLKEYLLKKVIPTSRL